MKHFLKSLLAILFIIFVTESNAADLTVICNIKEVAKNQTQSTYKLKYEINFEPRFYKSYVDKGNGFRNSEEGFPKDINATKVVFTEDTTTNQYYELKTSQYYYKNAESEVEATGACSQEKRDAN